MRSRHALGAVVAALSLLAVATPAGAQSRIEKNLDLQPGGQLVCEIGGGKYYRERCGAIGRAHRSYFRAGRFEPRA